MKIIKIKFLGKEYEINCSEEETSKIINLGAKLNNRIKQSSKFNYNFSDTHKLLIVAIYLEDQINDLLNKQKILLEKIDLLGLEKEKFKQNIHDISIIKKRLEIINTKIVNILEKLKD